MRLAALAVIGVDLVAFMMVPFDMHRTVRGMKEVFGGHLAVLCALLEKSHPAGEVRPSQSARRD